jgi:hypothetical protein
MRASIRLVDLLTLLTALAAMPAQAQVVETFVEGHVFNRWTGVPIVGALVRLPDSCIPCARPPIPQVLTTDDNGFYSARFVGGSSLVVIPIEVVCMMPGGQITGESRADLRPGTVRRDVFLRAPRTLSRCGLRAVPGEQQLKESRLPVP